MNLQKYLKFWVKKIIAKLYQKKSSHLEKTKILANNAIAINSLRVCWKSPDKYNCSKCRKCLLTMLALDICGKLNKSQVFDQGNLVELIKEYADFKNYASRVYFNELVVAYKDQNPNSEIYRVLRNIQRKQMFYIKIKSWVKRLLGK